MNNATREIFGNIPQSQHVIFYLLATISMPIFAFGLLSHFRRWTTGKIDWGIELEELPQRLRYLATQVFQQPRIRAQRLSGAMHLFIFWGFLILFVRTDIAAVEHYGPVSFFHGLFYLLFKLVMNWEDAWCWPRSVPMMVAAGSYRQPSREGWVPLICRTSRQSGYPENEWKWSGNWSEAIVRFGVRHCPPSSPSSLAACWCATCRSQGSSLPGVGQWKRSRRHRSA